jgi:hypothetical protein
MKWEEESILKGKDEVVEVTSGFVDQIKKDEAEAAQKRAEAELRVLEFNRRKAAKEAGIPYVSLAQEKRRREEQEAQERLEKEKITSIPNIWRAVQKHRHTVIGTIDLEKIKAPKKVEFQKQESIFVSDLVESLYKQALIVLGDEEIDEAYVEEMWKDFIHLYDGDEITRNMQEVAEKEEWIKYEDTPARAKLKKLATVLEAILVEGVTKYNWLGNKFKILPPSKYDELFNGVDGIIELIQDEKLNKFLALGIDVSFRSVEGELFEEKVSSLLGFIKERKLTQVKYFKDEKGDAIPDLYVPKVIISVDAKTIEEVAEIWSKRKEPEFKEKLTKHPLAFMIIGQIAQQCTIFSAYARKVGAEKVAEKYDEVFSLLLKISEEIPEAKKALSQFEENKFISKIQEIVNKKD